VTAGDIIDRIGGPKAVMGLTKLSKGRISQWRTENHIPRVWLLYLKEKKPSAFRPRPAPRRTAQKEVRV
jgi:hypothetical protein